MAYKRNRWGSIILDSGETITKSEQRSYILKVKRVNEKRQRLLNQYYEQAKNTPNMINISKEAYASLLEEKGYITEKLTTSFKGIVNKEEFRGELSDLGQLTSKGYNEFKIKALRNKILEQMNYSLGSAGVDVRRTIRNMTDSELANMYIHAGKDMLAEIFGSDGSFDDQEERAESVRSTMSYLINNITIKTEGKQSLAELKAQRISEIYAPPKRGSLIKNKNRKKKR